MRSRSGFARLIVRFPRVVVAVTLTVTALAAYAASGIRVESSLDRIIDPDLSSQQRLTEFKRTFATGELIVIALYQSPTVFTAPVLARIDKLTRTIEQLDGVERVVSITNLRTPDMRGVVPRITPSYSRYPETDRGLAAFAAEIEAVAGGILVSRDRSMAAVYVHVPDSGKRANSLVVELEELARETATGVFVVGGPKVRWAMSQAAVNDTLIALTVTLLIIMLTLALVFRNAWLVALPLTTILIATLWTGALMVLIDVPINPWTAMIAPLILVIGVANAIHIQWAYQRRCAAAGRPAIAVYHALRTNLAPCALATVTTALGLLSLAFSTVPVLVDFALCAAFGVVAAYVLCVTFLPASLVRADLRTCRPGTGLVAVFNWIVNRVQERRRIIMVSFFALAMLFTYGLQRLRVDTDFLNVFRPDHEIAVAHRFVESHLGGTFALELVVHGQPGAMQNVETMRVLDRLQAELESLPLVVETFSAVEILKLANMYSLRDQRQYRLPENQAAVDRLVFAASRIGDVNGIYKLVTRDLSSGRIVLWIRSSGTAAITRLIAAIEDTAVSVLPASLHLEITGTTVVHTDAVNQLVKSQALSFLVALVTILTTIIVVFRSWRIGVFAIAPNMLPILSVFGVMGLAGISLDFFNVMIASIALGIAVDDSTHFLTWFRRALVKTRSVQGSVAEAARQVGTPVVATSLIVGLGFVGVAATTTLAGTARFGYVTAFAILIALLTTALLLPSLLSIFWRTKKT